MKRTALTLALLISASPVLAQDHHGLIFATTQFRAYERGLPVGVETAGRIVNFHEVDRNRSGAWDPGEIRDAFGHAAKDVVLSFDANADGRVSLLELRAFDDGGTGGPDGRLWERVRD
ncbi:MAG: EF-hand domain-containing protein [Paracoccaceae bacterium]|nr:EF-hand domain-containing protein [Paracoccaceae bacterium]